MKKTIFVGCGGSGLKTLRLLRRELERQLEAVGIPRTQFPGCWQFVVVDVPAQEQSEWSAYADNDYVGLAPSNTPYVGPNGLERQLLSATTDEQFEDFVSWGPNPDDCNGIDLSIGAGQFRAVGRAVSLRGLKERLIASLDAVQQEIEGDPSIESSRAAAVALDAQFVELDGQNKPVKGDIFLVSSLGGGAGSGFFIDVADVIRSWVYQKSWNVPFGLLYEPSVFAADSNLTNSGISPNSYFALSELYAGRWNPWTVFPWHQGASGHGAYRGPQPSVILGAGQGQALLQGTGTGLTGRDAVYQSVASMLAMIAVGRSAASQILVEDILGNWPNRAGQGTRMLGVQGDTSLEKPFTSMGYASLSLGRTRYRRYVSERLARAVVERLVYPMAEPDVLSGKATVEELVAAKLAASSGLDVVDLVEDFLDEVGLNERNGDENNQVIDAVLNLGESDYVSAERAALTSALVKKVSSPSSVVRQFKDAWENTDRLKDKGGLTEITGVREVVEGHAATWADEVQKRVLAASMELVAREGFDVAIGTLEQVRTAVGTTFAEDLAREAEDFAGRRYQQVTDNFNAKIKEYKPGRRDRTLPDNVTGWFSELVGGRFDAIVERERRTVASKVLKSMATDFFTPLIDTLSESRATVVRHFQGPAFQNLTGEVPSKSLEAPANEVLVDPVKSYPARFREKFDPVLQDSLSVIFAGTFTADGPNASRSGAAEQTAHRVVSEWRPPVDGNRAKALQVDVSVGLESLLARIGTWVESTDSPDSTYVNETLRTWLIDNAASDDERIARASKLAKMLKDLFKQATPSVEVNEAWLNTRFDAPVREFLLANVPVQPGDGQEVYDAIDGSLAGWIQNPAARQKSYDAESSGDIELFASYHPVCASGFVSLASPIHDAYSSALAGRGDSNKSDFFSRSRRTRRLTETIAMPPASIQTIIRGWVNARLLDAVSIDPVGLDCEIQEGGQTYSVLPPISLDDPESAWSWLGWTLESSLLAIIEASMGNTGGLDALDALLRLGNSHGQPAASLLYKAACPALRANPTPPGLAKYFGESQTIPEAMDVAIAHIEGLQIQRSNGDVYERIPADYQLRDHIVPALEQIRDADYSDDGERPPTIG